MRSLELLAPAKNIEIGMAAINHGADAVYIGPSNFGARDAVGNSVSDIAKLTKHAHRFHSKIFATMNTLLFDNELEQAHKLAWQLYDAGVDALIIQDMGMLEMDLPPIPLHASTQTHNLHLEKVQFLEKVGFDRVVLARECSIKDIEEIGKATNVELEAFVAGALCVSLSGQCYMSNNVGDRSANRGACGQPCRLPFDLVDSNGTKLANQKHLLSLKDLNLSDYVLPLARAGIKSFKIEGRLKDESYVINQVGSFRKRIDFVLDKYGNEFTADSQGKTTLDFDPAMEKTYNRGFTTYFYEKRNPEIVHFDSPKAIGDKVGVVKQIKANQYLVEMQDGKKLIPGDGLCFYDKYEKLQGMKVEHVDNEGWIKTSLVMGVRVGAEIYRNYDQAFNKELKSQKTVRKIESDISMTWKNHTITLSIKDIYGNSLSQSYKEPFEVASNKEKAEQNLQKSLKKTGNTIFLINEVTLPKGELPFIPSGKLNQMRRDLIDAFEAKRNAEYKQAPRLNTEIDDSYPFPAKIQKWDHHGNVLNKLARQFYAKHGVTEIEEGFEGREDKSKLRLMTTKHCLRYQIGLCDEYETFVTPPENVKYPLFLQSKKDRYKLKFNCKDCVMMIDDAPEEEEVNS
ncbi:peptidase U32 family protein [Flammeovirga agarivorans]|uniref:U32 family peptidase n=1 Tax=Flammeovirga agarivorans TaxID=2726742 RepID=A0A7X8SLU4_9BACT|nr:U32 family peptidase [Flammeovirga agarivorans]NLR92528.1 U32 family peptidase [Flammeovirga agarivorans]